MALDVLPHQQQHRTLLWAGYENRQNLFTEKE